MRKIRLYKQTILKLILAAIIFIPLLSHCFFAAKQVSAPQTKINEVIVKEISSSELDSFLKIWPIYVQEKIGDKSCNQISLSMKSSVVEINRHVKKWFWEKGWSADRFCYVEQRLRTILKTLENDKLIANNIEGLKDQLQIGGQSQLSGMIEDLITDQQQRFNIEKISRQELDMVGRRQKEILQILN